MKKAMILLLLSFPLLVQAQFKTQNTPPPMKQVIGGPANQLFGSLFSPGRFTMHHDFSMSFITGGGGSAMMNAYQNTMYFRLSNPLLLRVNLGIVSFPYASFGNRFLNQSLNEPQLFGGAELLVRPSENTLFRLGFQVQPGYLSPYRSFRPFSWSEQREEPY